MRILLLLLMISTHLFSQESKIGLLKLTSTKIGKENNSVDTICDFIVSCKTFVVVAKSKAQVRSSYSGTKNKWKEVKTKLKISYVYDTLGFVNDSIKFEIEKYLIEQELWAKENNVGSDFHDYGYYKTFYLGDSCYYPFIYSGDENVGSYIIISVNKYVYKISLLENKAMGCLSSFYEQNCVFEINGLPIKLGKYLKDTNQVRKALSYKFCN